MKTPYLVVFVCLPLFACEPKPSPAISAPVAWSAQDFGMRAVSGWRPIAAESLRALNPHASFGAIHQDGTLFLALSHPQPAHTLERERERALALLSAGMRDWSVKLERENRASAQGRPPGDDASWRYELAWRAQGGRHHQWLVTTSAASTDLRAHLETLLKSWTPHTP